MKLGVIGLGRMGSGIAERVLKAGHSVVGFDLDKNNCDLAADLGVHIAQSVESVAKECRVIWLMVPPGKPVDLVIDALLPHLQEGDILVDGGNSNFHDSIARAQRVAKNNVHYLDCGTSGGLRGRIEGYCLMVGGEQSAYNKIDDLLKAIAAPGGYGYMGPSGAGHYVKMVHNGIEYGLLQAYAEGFELLKDGSFKKEHLDLEEISRLWNHGSVIRSWLLELAHNVFKNDTELKNISGKIAEGGTGKWTVEDAHTNNVQVPVIEKSLEVRAWSRESGGNYATKVIQMLRNQFGGHEIKKID